MIIEKAHFSAKDTFECGQCFRWEKVEDAYVGVVGNALLEVREKEMGYEVTCVAGEVDFDLAHYLDSEVPFEKMKAHLMGKDAWLEKAVAYGNGIRLLNQSPFETLITFIISSNNNIPKIKMAVEALSFTYGAFLTTYKGKDYYSFPTPSALYEASLEDLKVKGMGYRNLAIYNTVHRLVDEQIDLMAPYAMAYEDGKAFLKAFYGVGDKVADCVLLFAYEKKNVFPVDTWVKRMLRDLYGVEDKPKAYQAFVDGYFKDYGGYAQQYLFHYIRSL